MRVSIMGLNKVIIKPKQEVQDVLSQFRIQCSSCSIIKYRNVSAFAYYYVVNSNKRKSDYIVQKVDVSHFGDIKKGMEEVSFGLELLKSDIYLSGPLEVEFIKTKKGNYHFYEADGVCWRVCKLLTRYEFDACTRNKSNAYAWANAFGKFLSCLDEIPLGCINEIKLSHREMKKEIHLKKEHKMSEEICNRIAANGLIDYAWNIWSHLIQLNELISCFRENHAQMNAYSSSTGELLLK